MSYHILYEIYIFVYLFLPFILESVFVCTEECPKEPFFDVLAFDEGRRSGVEPASGEILDFSYPSAAPDEQSFAIFPREWRRVSCSLTIDNMSAQFMYAGFNLPTGAVIYVKLHDVFMRLDAQNRLYSSPGERERGVLPRPDSWVAANAQ